MTEPVNDLQAEVAAMELEDDDSLSHQLAAANAEVAKLTGTRCGSTGRPG